MPQAVRKSIAARVISRTMSRTGNVRVSFRLRPMNEEEQKEERYGCVKVNQERARVSVRDDGTTKHFNFDKVRTAKYFGNIKWDTVNCPIFVFLSFVLSTNCATSVVDKYFQECFQHRMKMWACLNHDMSDALTLFVCLRLFECSSWYYLLALYISLTFLGTISCSQVFDDRATQAFVYKESVAPLVSDFLSGRSCCILAYGERGSGKSFTMNGPSKIVEEDNGDNDDDLSSIGSAGVSQYNGEGRDYDDAITAKLPGQVFTAKPRHKSFASGTYKPIAVDPSPQLEEVAGMIPRIINELFEKIRKKTSDPKKKEEPSIRFSFLEVSNECTIDLLDQVSERDVGNDRSPAGRHEGIVIEKNCRKASEVMLYIQNGMLHRSERMNRIGSDCTRSHSVVVFKLDRYSKSRGKQTTSSLFLVDLANSALVRRPPPDADTLLLNEAKSVKRSLGALRKCFRVLALNDRSPSPPYTESELTKILRDTLVRGAGISLIVTANPLTRNVHESLSAIRYGTYVAGQRMESSDDSSRDFDGSGRSPVIPQGPKTAPTTGISKKSDNKNQASSNHENINATTLGSKVPSLTENPKDADNGIHVSPAQSVEITKPKERVNGFTPQNQPGGEIVSLPVQIVFDRDNQTNDGMTCEAPGSRIKQAHDELEATNQSIVNMAEGPSTYHKSNDTKDPSVAHVSTLLLSASMGLEADLSITKRERHATGHKSMTEVEMEEELAAVSKELESMKYDGHLSHHIQKQVLAAQEELRKLSLSNHSDPGQHEERDRQGGSKRGSLPAHFGRHVPNLSPHDVQSTATSMEPTHDGRSISTDESEIDRLLEELEALKEENERLARESVDRDEDLANAEIELLELRQKVATGVAAAVTPTEEDIEKPSDSRKPPRTSTTSVTTEMSESAMTNMVGRNFVVDIIKEENDPWEEPDEEISPAPVRVCLRLRPMTKLERNRRSRSCIEVHEGNRQFTVDSPLDGEYDFCFDDVFNVDSPQKEVYESVGISLVDSLLQGVNCAVMAYGLSGSGKTHLLTGKLPELVDDRSEGSSDDDSMSTDATPTEEDAGLLPRVICDLFRGMREYPEYIEFRLTCTYVAIFLEKMFDLLDPKFDKTLLVKDTTYGIAVEGAVEAFCFDEEDIIQLIRRGTACRKLIGNNLNIDPNRSHAIFMLNMEQRHVRSGAVRRSNFQLSELAGFEVTSKAKGQSVQETKIIHKSFSALGNVIKCLTEGNQYVPYREAKLTSVLKDAFGGNCRTTLFITASPSSYNISETINSIRLGQRVRRVTNKPRMNKDAGIEDYRKWLLQTEIKFGELSALVQEFAKDLVKENNKNGRVKPIFSTTVWQTIHAIANEEESVHNPCRKALVLGENEEQLQSLPKWRSLSIELAKRMPSDTLVDATRARDRAESLLTDIQSESVVLRRQNELLVQEKRKKEEELDNANADTRKTTLKNSELEHKLALAENRSKEALHFLRYMRSLCWKLRKDTEKDRPISITEITSTLVGAPDLSGLVDLDSLMVDAGFIENQSVDLDKVEAQFFDYLEEAGLVIARAAIEEDDEEVDELAGLEDGIDGEDGGNSRWVKRAATAKLPRTLGWDDQSIASRGTTSMMASHIGEPTLFGLTMPWQNKKEDIVQERYEPHASNARMTRREQELQRDLQNMANKCVDLQVELNEKKLMIGSICNRSGDLQKKKLVQETLTLAKERDRMIHHAKAAAWKLQEVRKVGKKIST